MNEEILVKALVQGQATIVWIPYWIDDPGKTWNLFIQVVALSALTWEVQSTVPDAINTETLEQILGPLDILVS